MNADLGQIVLIIMITGFLPFIAVISTSFAKISVVLLIVRNALGIQQTPPNIVLMGIAIVLTAKVMSPVFTSVYDLAKNQERPTSIVEMMALAEQATAPWRQFLVERTSDATRLSLAGGDEVAINGPDTLAYTFSYVVPAYLADELTKAFQVGLLIYLCFAMVDLIVGVILIAIGMQSMSPVVISTPLKLLLFIAVEGWTRLLQNLILAG